MMMRRIGLRIKNISPGDSSNSQWASKEGIHATLTPLGRFGAFVSIAEGLDEPGSEILLVLGKAEVETKVGFFWKMWGLMSTLLIL